MFRFEKEQSVVNISGVKFGGQPGELPTVLCGTIFYQGHRIVIDDEIGIFDRDEAWRLVQLQAELSDQTGCPAVIHIYARSLKAFLNYLDFVDEVWDGPFIMDSADAGVRAGMAGIVTELGFADRAVYNSISVATSDTEAEAVKDSDVDSAIVLAYNPSDSSVDGSLSVMETGGSVKSTGLLPLANDLGFVNLLIDPGVVPVGSGAGRALRFSVVAKARFGLPVGSGIHNAVSSWPWLKGMERLERRCCDAAATALQQISAGDFVLYGPIENAGFIFPVAAMADIMIAEAVRDLGVQPVRDHPVNRLA